jgi:RNA polymerase sigma factor (sigma-70 family)
VGRESIDVDKLFQRYGPMVLRRCRQLLREEDEALDVTQDVFVQLLENRDRLDARYPSSLLYRIATNLSLNRLRDRARNSTSPDEELLHRIASMETPGARGEARLILDYLFGRHHPSSRTIAVLHFLDGLTLEQVAHEVGMSVSGVRKRIRALRRTLTEMEAP